MKPETEQVVASLTKAFPDVDFKPSPLIDRGDGHPGTEQIFVRVPSVQLPDVMLFLRDDKDCRFNQLCDLTCVDYLEFPRAKDRYGVVYSLLSLERNDRIWVKCFVNDPSPEVSSVTSVWRGAEWMEREVWDMFGVRFTDHPDLRRILTWDGFKAHPLRKDYPLRGLGEREDYKVLDRESR
jgi:NADH-quinone oxidoreductase subunit C